MRHMTKFFTLLLVLLSYALSVSAQLKTVTGRITDQQGQPVPFATVKVKGTNRGTSADADGAFSIKAKNNDVLLVTGTGVTGISFTITDESAVQVIKVTQKETGLTEVVVTALG